MGELESVNDSIEQDEKRDAVGDLGNPSILSPASSVKPRTTFRDMVEVLVAEYPLQKYRSLSSSSLASSRNNSTRSDGYLHSLNTTTSSKGVGFPLSFTANAVHPSTGSVRLTATTESSSVDHLSNIRSEGQEAPAESEGRQTSYEFASGQQLSMMWRSSSFFSPFASKTSRLEATMTIKERYTCDPESCQKVRAIERLDRKSEDAYDNLVDKFSDELMITGRLWFDYFTPAAPGTHRCFFTYTFVLICLGAFLYMSGVYPFWMISEGGFMCRDVSELYSSQPQGCSDWLFGSGDKYIFSFDFLRIWGGRYLPDVYKGQNIARWVTSLFLHESNHHLLSNLFFFIILTGHLEHKYGTPRIATVAMISGIGGNFFSALVEDGCVLVLGSSGLIFGLFGVYIVDIILNFESVRRPLLQGLAIVVSLFYLIWTTASNLDGSSHFSHVGGLLCGLFPGFLVLPNFHKEDWEAIIPYLAFLGVLFSLIVLPVLVYTQVLPNIECQLR